MLRGLTLKMKLSLGFGATLLLLLAVGAIGYEATVRMADANGRAVEFLDMARLSAKMTESIEKQSTGVRGFLIQEREDLLKHDQEGQTEFAEASSKMESSLTTEQGKKLFGEIRSAFQRWRKYADEEVALRRAGKNKEAVAVCFSGETNAARNDLLEALRQLEEFQNKRSSDAVEDGRQVESSTRLMLLVCGLMGCGIGMTIAFMLTRSITHATGEMVRMIRKIADNDLAIPDMEVKGNDELGQAGQALNEMKHKLNEVLQTIAVSAEHVASASEEISAGARDSAETAKNQLGQTMQATTAMHEMTTTVQQISENSQAAAETSGEAARLAEKGGEVVKEVLSSMRKIAESTTKTSLQVTELGRGSEEIGKIVAVINDIADQTNLLALNAAIEAARAGEQGRGFAVVADEVRKLAERTTKATKEIAGMIESIQKETKNAVEAMEQAKHEVEAGVHKTSDSGEALKRIIEMSRKVGDMITQIATAATEQSAATEQVNGNVAHISNATQESAAAAAQVAKACADLSNQALELQSIVRQFKVAARGARGGGNEPGRARGAAAGR